MKNRHPFWQRLFSFHILIGITLAVLFMSFPVKAVNDKNCYGSLVYSVNEDGTKSWGVTWSFNNQNTATARAMAECWNSGGVDCDQIGDFKAVCIDVPDGGSSGFTKNDDVEGRIVTIPLPTDVNAFRDCPDCPEMVVIPPGSFQMGCMSKPGDCNTDELLSRMVTFDKPFALSKTEITFSQWDKCAVSGGCDEHWPRDEGWGRGENPVINVNWEDTHNYARWLSKLTGEDYYLPTESQWEYAARAGSKTKYSWGDEIGVDLANCGRCGVSGNLQRQTMPVGSFPPNAWGLYDMHGNVWEWVQDIYQIGYSNAPTDGTAYTTITDGEDELHVLRGGSWISSPKYLRAAYRFRYAPDVRYFIAGFRVARVLNEGN